LLTYYSDQFPIQLPPGHRFPIEKYRILRQLILSEQTIPEHNLHVPDPARKEQLYLAHDPEYVEKVFQGELSDREIRRIGFPWSAELVVRSQHSVGGTTAACRAGIRDGAAANLAGGTHHAHRDFGSGYCLFNDCAVATKVIQQEKLAKQVMILDCDVHQGDGTAAIFSADPSVYSFSIHGARNFPFHKVPSDLDIELEDGSGDEIYLEKLNTGLMRAFENFKPDFVIYLAGADPFFDDRLGRLALTKKGLAERDLLVLNNCKQKGLPFAVVLAGGYARRIADTVEIHKETIHLAAKLTN
jgi:acetoin utilization deacetylase AcuC-like enzyme